MIDKFVKRPVMTLMFVMVFVVMGAVSYNDMVIEETPKMAFPIVVIKAVYSGASPQEIESQVIKKIEDAVSDTSQIDKIESYVYENFGLIMISFNMGVDVAIKSMEVKDKLEPILSGLPEGAEKPEVSKFDPLVSSIIDLFLTGPDERQIYEYADKKLRDQLTSIEGVAGVDIYGGKERQINVKLDSQLMEKYYFSIADVINAISARNVNVPGGTMESVSGSRNAVRILGEFTDVEELRSLKLVSREGTVIKLSDIATVEDSFKKVDMYARFNGENGVGLAVKKLADGDEVRISGRIRSKLPEIQESLPEGMELVIAYDSSIKLIKDTNTTVLNILTGIFLCMVILLFFLEDLRTTMVAVVVIPTSLISSFFLMSLSGFTINMITLLAMATALGTLIANALVVIENISRHIEMGKTPAVAAVDGTVEAVTAVFAAAGTNLVVFTPIVMMGGIIGIFMRHFGLTVIYLTLFSILASFSLTPMMCALLLKIKADKEENSGSGIFSKIAKSAYHFQKLLLREYKILFVKVEKHPYFTVLMCGLVFISIIYPLQYMGSEFMPSSDEDAISISLELPQGKNVNDSLKIVKKVENIVSKLPETVSYLSYIGTDREEGASMKVNLKPLKQRTKVSKELINDLIPAISSIPGADIILSDSLHGSSMMGGDLSINVYGKDYAKIIELSETMMELMEQTGNFRSINSSYKKPKKEIRFIPDDSRMLRAGLRNSQVGDAVRFSIRGNDKNIYKDGVDEYKININLDDEYQKTLEDIGKISLMSKEGLLQISKLGKIQAVPGFSEIRRRDRTRVVNINAFLSKSTAGEMETLLEEKFTNIDFPEGYGYKYVGRSEMMEDSIKEIVKAFMLAVILTYMLLAAIMNSFLYPFVIAISVAMSMVGVVYLMFFLDYSISILAMMSMVMLVGLSVNNGILMLDYTFQRREAGVPIIQALWEGASVKFRSILMTSLAIILGTLPQLFDPFKGKAVMGGVIIGGVFASIIFTFILTPALFTIFERLRNVLKKRK